MLSLLSASRNIASLALASGLILPAGGATFQEFSISVSQCQLMAINF